jgi:hypothetical protein
MTTDVNGLNAWDRRPRELLEEAYVAAGDGPARRQIPTSRSEACPATCVLGHELTGRSNQVETL